MRQLFIFFTSLSILLISFETIDRRTIKAISNGDHVRFKTKASKAISSSQWIVTDNLDLVYSHFEEKKVFDRLRIEELNKELSTEQAIVDDRDSIFESRMRYFENQYSNKDKLLQALLGAGVPGRYKSLNKEPLLQLAVRSEFAIPGVDLLPTLRGLKYFDEEGNKKTHMFSDQKRQRKGYKELYAGDGDDSDGTENRTQG